MKIVTVCLTRYCLVHIRKGNKILANFPAILTEILTGSYGYEKQVVTFKMQCSVQCHYWRNWLKYFTIE